jgi:hypothetical protein
MVRVRNTFPKRLQFTLTLIGLTILAIIGSVLYLIGKGVWKLLWPIRKLISKIRRR